MKAARTYMNSENKDAKKLAKSAFERGVAEFETLLRVINHFTVQRYVHMEVE